VIFYHAPRRVLGDDKRFGVELPCQLQEGENSMKRTCIRLILLLVMVCMQTSCLCWSHCPQGTEDVVKWHTPVRPNSAE